MQDPGLPSTSAFFCVLADHAVHAVQGEFEAGFEQGGQTREHAHLAKTLGVTKLIVAINKMDDPSILPEDGVWPQSRYDEIEKGLTPFLRSCGCVLWCTAMLRCLSLTMTSLYGLMSETHSSSRMSVQAAAR